ncbi:MAG: thioredoxin family protein [Phycisphaerae bacterium]
MQLISILAMIAPLGEPQGKHPLPVLVLVVGEGCAACRQVEPHAHLLARKGMLHIVEYERHPDWCRQHGITSIPHLIVWYRRGDETRRADYIGSDHILQYARRK